MFNSNFPNPPCGTHIKPLGSKHMPELLELQETVGATLPEEFLERDDAAYYARLFEGKGRVLGLYDGGNLLAFSVVSWPLSCAVDNLGADIDLDINQRAHVVHLESAYVIPFWQGRGIAKLLSGMQIDFSRQMGKRHALSTVAPGNLYSIKNLFSLGFSIRKIAVKYRYKIRCIMYRNISTYHAEISQNFIPEGLWISSADLAAQRGLLAQGYRGIDVKGTKGDFSIFYINYEERGDLCCSRFDASGHHG